MSSLLTRLVVVHSWHKLMAATTTMFLAGISDAVWLVPYISNHSKSNNNLNGISYGFIWISSFTILISIICLVTVVIYNSTLIMKRGRDEIDTSLNNFSTTNNERNNNGMDDDTETLNITQERLQLFSSVIGAILCWSIAGYMYYKEWVKQHKQCNIIEASNISCDLVIYTDTSTTIIDTLDVTDIEGQLYILHKSNEFFFDHTENVHQRHPDILLTTPTKQHPEINTSEILLSNTAATSSTSSSNAGTSTSAGQIWTIISLSTIGAIDEVALVPSLIIGNTFSPGEIIIGSILSRLLIVFIILVFVEQCKPILYWLEQIPSYGTITLFALILSYKVCMDII